jgi:hypothetical protein
VVIVAAQPQMIVPTPSPGRPTMLEIGVHRAAGRLELCLRCGVRVWTCFGRAARHHARCRSEQWPEGRP